MWYFLLGGYVGYSKFASGSTQQPIEGATQECLAVYGKYAANSYKWYETACTDLKTYYCQIGEYSMSQNISWGYIEWTLTNS